MKLLVETLGCGKSDRELKKSGHSVKEDEREGKGRRLKRILIKSWLV